MGECGCETAKVARLPGVNGAWFVLEVYPGCQYCGADWGLGVTRVSEGDEEWEWWAAKVPVATFDRLGMWGMPLLNAGVLRRLFAKADGGADDLSEANFALSEFVSRGGLRDVFHETMRAATPQEDRHDG